MERRQDYCSRKNDMFAFLVKSLLMFFMQFNFIGSLSTNNNSSTSRSPDPTNSTRTTTARHLNAMPTDFKGVGLRAIYVIAAISLVVIFYLVTRAVCSKRRRNKTRRYGILGSETREMEMRPLSEHDDEDDDDLTLFDKSNRNGKR